MLSKGQAVTVMPWLSMLQSMLTCWTAQHSPWTSAVTQQSWQQLLTQLLGFALTLLG